nr:unnamed protein product [Callosobruchus chinensis]
MKELILPALKEGKTVICDRFIDSTIAYQGYGLGVDLSLIRDLHKLVEIKYPDITFILDIDVQVGLSRAKEKIMLIGFTASKFRTDSVNTQFLIRKASSAMRYMHKQKIKEGKKPIEELINDKIRGGKDNEIKNTIKSLKIRLSDLNQADLLAFFNLEKIISNDNDFFVC